MPPTTLSCVTRREAWATGFDCGAGKSHTGVTPPAGGICLVPISARDRPLERADRTRDPRMSIADLQELDEVKALIARGLQLGVLTHAEIATAALELDLEDGDIEELHAILERGEIELVD